MELLSLLIFLPIVGAIIAFLAKGRAMNIVVVVTCVAVASISIVCTTNFYLNFSTNTTNVIGPALHELDVAVMGINLLLCYVIIRMSLKYKQILPIVLAIMQILIEITYECFFKGGGLADSSAFTIDALTVIMVVIIGIVGGGICIYATGYMQDFQDHEPKDATDRRGQFFFLCVVFLSAMFLIVFSNNMSYMFCGWEITTVCSFLLIGYTKSDEAIKNAFLQINLNLIGGISFILAIFFSSTNLGIIQFSDLLAQAASNNPKVQIPLVLFSVAALTKAAQAPFHKWLLGAMVAPTPTSALLHSSTMVKAGVFLLIKLSPAFLIYQNISMCISLVGGITFLFASLMAISQSNGKRVLAYSTIANLGLIVLCASLGDQSLVWAAILLLIFHAIAKSLLFLCVGTAEHHIGSRDIESFDHLFNKMPQLARFMMLGIFIMFVAPFGMLIAKWGVIASLADRGDVVLLMILAFGSAATFMYWAKWLGKLAGISNMEKSIESTVSTSENFALYIMGILLIITNMALPYISQFFVLPEIYNLFNDTSKITITNEMLTLCSIITFIVIVSLFVGIGKKSKNGERQLLPYMAGITVDGEKRTFKAVMQPTLHAHSRNLYLENIFGEHLAIYAQILSGIYILASLLLAVLNSGVF